MIDKEEMKQMLSDLRYLDKRDSFYKDIFISLQLWEEYGRPLFILPTTKQVISRIPQSNWMYLIQNEMEAGVTPILEAKEKFFYGFQVLTIKERKIVEILKFGCGQKCEFRTKLVRRVKHFHIYENVLLELLPKYNFIYEFIGDVEDHLIFAYKQKIKNKFFIDTINNFNYENYYEIF